MRPGHPSLSRESVAKFVAELRRLSAFCEFGTTLNDMLRDRLICGINDSRMQRSLLAAEKDLTFKDAFAKAQAMESADAETTRSWKPTCGQVSRRPEVASTTIPLFLLRGKHRAAECRFQDAVCHFCKKKGHLARVYRNKGKQQQGQRPEGSHEHYSTNVVGDEQESGVDKVYTLFNLHLQVCMSEV